METAFTIDADLVVHITLLSSSRGQPISLLISLPQGVSKKCSPLMTHKPIPLVVSQQASRHPYRSWSVN